MTVRLPTIPKRVDDLTVVSWNVKVGRRSIVTDLREIIHDHDPQVLCLQEAKGHAPELRKALRDFRVIAAHGRPEADNCTTLVHRDLGRPNWRTLDMDSEWTGPKANIRHAGRTFLVTDFGGRNGWRIVNVHRTKPHWGEAAFREEHAALLTLANRPGSWRRTLIIVGDQNAESSDTSGIQPAGLAVDIRADRIRTGAKVDWAILRGARGSGGRSGFYGSDHPVVSFKFVKK